MVTWIELWGVYWGLSIAKNRGFRNVWLKLDSSCVYHFISHGVVNTHAVALLVDAVRILISESDWNVEANLVYPKAKFLCSQIG